MIRKHLTANFTLFGEKVKAYITLDDGCRSWYERLSHPDIPEFPAWSWEGYCYFWSKRPNRSSLPDDIYEMIETEIGNIWITEVDISTLRISFTGSGPLLLTYRKEISGENTEEEVFGMVDFYECRECGYRISKLQHQLLRYPMPCPRCGGDYCCECDASIWEFRRNRSCK